MKNVGFSFYLQREREPGLYARHKHDCCELVYYADAHGTTYIADKEYPLTPGTLAVIPADTAHTDRYLSTSQVLCLGFFCDKAISPDVISDEEGEFPLFFREIGRELRHNADLGNEVINRCIDIVLLKYLRRNQVPDSESNLSRRLGYTAQYIRSNYSTKIDFHELAAGIGYSYDHFRHLFTEIHGCTPKHFLLTVRMDRAKYLLRNTDKRIKSIALECGFAQSSQFVAAFGSFVGMTPTDYRSRIRVDTVL